MALDFDKIRAEFEKLQAQEKGASSGGGDFINKFYQIPEGNSSVRILPPKDDDKLFFAATKIHRVPIGQGQTRNVHCLKVHDEPCPLCDAYYALWKAPYNNEDLARQIKPRDRYYMNVVDRQDEDNPVKILSVGIILYKKIINTILDEDFGDVTDLMTGRDFRLNKIMEGPWPKYDQSVFRPKETAAGTNQQIAQYMDMLHDIHALVKREDYAEVKQMAESLLISGEASTERPLKSEAPANTPVAEDDFLSRLKNND